MRAHADRGPRHVTAFLLLAAALVTTAARAGEFVRIENVDLDDLAAESFRLRRPLTVRVRCEGAGDRREGTLNAYGWILDLQSRQVVWKLQIDDARRGPGDNFAFEGDVEIPAGEYTAYFSPFIQHYKSISFLGKELGRVYIKRSDRQPRHSNRWGLRLSVADAEEDQVSRFEPTSRRADPLR